MNIALVLPGNIWFSPYLRIYTNMLDKWNVEYDIISWNRDGKDEKMGFQFEEHLTAKERISKLKPYIHYLSFIKKTIKANHYSKLIVFGPQMAILLSSFLEKYYKNNYIFDYRDLSIEQNKFLAIPFKKVLRNSVANVISSPGFKRCLPATFEYLLSHNFDVDIAKNILSTKKDISLHNHPIEVLTIGSIRDYSSNIEVVKALANIENIIVNFVGKGDTSTQLQEYCVKHKISNVHFYGFYKKEEESGFIDAATFMNIFYPRKVSHDTALSNRFYNSLIYKRPMIVTKDSVQGDFVEKYKVGLALENCDDLSVKINNYLRELDVNKFVEQCDSLLSSFIKDQELLERTVEQYVKN